MWVEGELILVRMPTKKEEQIAADILPLPSCMGFFMATELWRHRQYCPLYRSQEPHPPPPPMVNGTARS